MADKYLEMPLETWSVQEFTYLNRERCLNTTLAERMSENGMKRFRRFLRAYAIPNESVLEAWHDEEFWHGTARTGHLSKHL